MIERREIERRVRCAILVALLCMTAWHEIQNAPGVFWIEQRDSVDVPVWITVFADTSVDLVIVFTRFEKTTNSSTVAFDRPFGELVDRLIGAIDLLEKARARLIAVDRKSRT